MDQQKLHILATTAFVLITLDSLMVYIGKQIAATILPVNMIVPLILAILLVIKGKNYLLPDKTNLTWLAIAVLGFTSGIFTISELGFPRLFEIGSAATAFITGYIFAKWVKDENEAAKPLMLIGVLYTTVCVIAVSKILPQYFPIIIKLWAHNGQLIERPEVTTDQNFQIFYLIPGIIIFSLPFQKIRFSLAIYILLGSLYALAALQTRSGLLIALGLVFLATISPIWAKTLGKWKLYVIPALGLLIAIIFLPSILNLASGIIIRFTETDYSTGLGRLHSFLYLFEKIYNPIWWLPQGNKEFLELTGNIPHANPTAVFLDGGMFALVAWVALTIVPLLKLSKQFMKSKLDNLAVMLFLGAIGAFLAQLSLNVPLMDQVWLWAGITNGILARNKINTYKNTHARTETNSKISNNNERYPKLR
ncbi:MAG: hypothetical protein OQL06_11320 [Gammaproteobacteria bacterium]|nr:hypothetical protein [Gammaproteobacteria bacterium]